MASRGFEGVAGPLQSLLVLGSPSVLTDGQLLERFATGEGPSASLAFEVLIDRHGAMVLRVCRSILREPNDAEDAFQATFLVLVKKARSIRDRDSLASWLHGVALRVARHARGVEARRRRLDRSIAVEGPKLARVEEPVDDLGSKLHDELNRLPERYRAAVVLCYLEGLSCEAAATALHWPIGTVKSRLSRAREKLRGRLTRLGLAPDLPALGRTDPAISPRLSQETATVATRFAVGKSDPGAAPVAFVLAKGALQAMTLAKLKIPALALLVAASLVGASSALSPGQPVQEPAKAQNPPQYDRRTGPKLQEPARKAEAVAVPEADPIARAIPRNLSVQGGTGTALLYALDANRERIVDGADKDQDAQAPKFREIAPGLFVRSTTKTGRYRETQVDLRWVVITGVLDNQAIREALARSKQIPFAEAFPAFKRADIQRQVRSRDGFWSDWVDVEKEKNWEILDNLPETTREVTSEQFRPDALVDPLPKLTKGSWNGVDPELVLDAPKPGLDLIGDGKRYYQSPILAVRSLDFTAESGKTYRYRVRIVFVNPDQDPKTLHAPWSEATADVKVP